MPVCQAVSQQSQAGSQQCQAVSQQSQVAKQQIKAVSHQSRAVVFGCERAVVSSC